MSSNIRITRSCEHCGQEFTAKTVRTRYYSHACNRRGYKKAERDNKIEAVKARIRVEPLKIKQDHVNWDELTQKPFLTVSKACLVLNVRAETLQRWIKEGIIRTNKVGEKHFDS